MVRLGPFPRRLAPPSRSEYKDMFPMYTKLLLNHLQYLAIISTFQFERPDFVDDVFNFQKASSTGAVSFLNSFECLIYGESQAERRCGRALPPRATALDGRVKRPPFVPVWTTPPPPRDALEGGELPPPPLQGAQPMPSHCPPDGKRRLQWHL